MIGFAISKPLNDNILALYGDIFKMFWGILSEVLIVNGKTNMAQARKSANVLLNAQKRPHL